MDVENKVAEQVEMEMAEVGQETPEVQDAESQAEVIEIGDLKIPAGTLDDATLKELEQRIERARSLEESNQELSQRAEQARAYEQKAALYDRFNELCEANPWLFDQIRAAHQGVQPDLPEDAFGDGVDGGALIKAISSLLDRRLSPVESKLSQLDRMLLVTNEVGELSKADPDARSLEPKIRQIMAKSPGLSVQDAYKIASHDVLVSKVRDADRIRKNNLHAANAVRKPSGADTGRPTRVDVTKLSREEAIEQAFREVEAKSKARNLGG